MAAHEVAVNCPKDIENQDFTEVRDILEGFVSKKASNDTTMGEERSSILTSLNEEREATRCIEVGQALADIADEMDLVNDELSQNLMGGIGAPDVAFNTFRSVAKNLFTWDSAGGQIVRITWRKIAALLGFCYSLCRQFFQSTDNYRSLKAFFAAVVGYLVRFLFEGRLLNWIRSQGGWVSVLQQPISQVSWTTAFTAIGLTVAVGLSVFAYTRLTS